jgi:hypothetical protein
VLTAAAVVIASALLASGVSAVHGDSRSSTAPRTTPATAPRPTTVPEPGCAIAGDPSPRVQARPSVDQGVLRPHRNGTLTPVTIDDRFVSVGERAPGFGGMFVDEGLLRVHLTDRSSVTAARRAIRQEFGRNKIVGPLLRRGIDAVQATYAFTTLKTWQSRLDPVAFTYEGVIFTDVDDSDNRLTIGVTCEITEQDIAEILSQANVPPEAVNVELAEPPERLLQLFHRPLVGGLQVTAPGGTCTLGFVARREREVGFVTNSHCTTTEGSLDGSVFFQPSTVGVPSKGFDVGDLAVGTELIDPPLIECLGLGKVCRYADAVFVRRRSANTKVSFGKVAKVPQQPPVWNGKTFRIVDEFSSFEGLPVTKTGRSTGTTSGSVDDVCVNQLSSSPVIMNLCSNVTSLFALKGDSGSPVVIEIGNVDVLLTGLLWGGNADDVAFYSDIELTENWIGGIKGLETCAPPFVC